jgi:tRNA A37 methylthiotransferase MiaB
MRVCLVSASTIAEFEDLEIIAEEDSQRVPLGVLALASTLEARGDHPEVIDLDALYAGWKATRRGRGTFAGHAAEHIAQRDADVYGLSTICGSYPLTLRIATALKEARPGCCVVLGGPQATTSADETLAAFPAVDVVVRGEGEPVLPALLDALASSADLSSVPGISHRSGGRVERTPDPPLLDDLDSLPLAAYHLHPGLRHGGSFPLEVGRGCPFSCTFCSTSRFFGRRFRMRSADRIVKDMLTLHRTFGTRSFDLIHDNFTVDRRRVVAFCEAISAARAGFTWSCSSRTDSLDDDLVDLMWRSGCRGLFFGVESGSEALQRSIRKRLDLEQARARLRRVSHHKVTATVSLIVGFPDEGREDLRDTVGFYVDALKMDSLEPQISLLSPLAGTPLHARHRHELVLDEVVSDMSFQGEEQDPADRALIARHPDIFSSFYCVPSRGLGRADLDELCRFLNNARYQLRWLLVAAAQVEGDGVRAFLAYRSWRFPGAPRRSRGAIAAYYRSPAFKKDLVRFVREDLARRHPAAGHALRALARYYGSIRRQWNAARATPRPARRPVRAPNVHLTRMTCDGSALMNCLRDGGDLAGISRRKSTVITRALPGRDEIVQVGDEAAELLRLCDGTRDARALARAFRRRHPRIGDVPAETAALFGLELFRRRGLLVT